MDFPAVRNEAAVLATLAGVPACFFWLERKSGWRVFNYLPPLVFIYAVPIALANSGVMPAESSVYDAINRLALPTMLLLMLIGLDLATALRSLGPGLVVMALGSVGVVVGAAVSMLLVGRWLEPTAWKAFAALAASWTGGTGNLAAVADMVDAGDERGLAVLADATMYSLWLPVLLAARNFREPFARWTGADRRRVEASAGADVAAISATPPDYRDLLLLLAVALGTTAAVDQLAAWLALRTPPQIPASALRILLVTTCGLGLSLTPLRRVAGSRELSLTLLFLIVANMGATARLDAIGSQAVPFVAGALVWIVIHGAFCLGGAWLMGVDVGVAAIASAANIGGAASAPVIAAHHDRRLTAASILMAMLGYAWGNYVGALTGLICRQIALWQGSVVTP